MGNSLIFMGHAKLRKWRRRPRYRLPAVAPPSRRQVSDWANGACHRRLTLVSI